MISEDPPVTDLSSVSPLVRDLEARLAYRRSIEEFGRRQPKGSSSLLWYGHRILKPLLHGALVGAGLYGRGVRNALKPEVRRHRLQLVNLPRELDGFRVLQISDLHVDGMDGLTEALCNLLPNCPADLCVLTGDYRFDVRGPCDRLYPRLRAILRAVRSRLGAVGILGNHDCADIAVELERLGVRMLVNDSLEAAAGFWVTGADELDGGEAFGKALRDVPPGAFCLALAHTPELRAYAADGGAALYLCGHTHAGQICLPGGTPLIVNASGSRAYSHGFWKRGATVGYTSAGAGCCMLPVRYNCPPEVTLFELNRSVTDREDGRKSGHSVDAGDHRVVPVRQIVRDGHD